MIARALRPAGAVLAAALACGPAAANDSIAELRPGGLAFVVSDTIAMEREDLFVSMDEVRVDYVFRNTGDRAETVTVAFPMPPIEGHPWVMPAIPDAESANFLDFTVTIDGAPVVTALQQRATVAGIDVTADLIAAEVPLEPFAERTFAAVEALPRAVRDDFVARGLLLVDTFDDDGTGMKEHPRPTWTLETVYHWTATFEPGAETRVSHRYRPSLGATAGLAFLDYEGRPNETLVDYQARYCMDEPFLAAVRKRVAAGETLSEYRIAYVLTTGRNWAGPIGAFSLTVDKGDPANLVSFCGEGVRKTGPTTFALEAADFVPERDLEVLVLVPQP
jgi:hypothetical protein